VIVGGSQKKVTIYEPYTTPKLEREKPNNPPKPTLKTKTRKLTTIKKPHQKIVQR